LENQLIPLSVEEREEAHTLGIVNILLFGVFQSILAHFSPFQTENHYSLQPLILT
jgi:hypothetical protein